MSTTLKTFSLYYSGPSPNPWKVAIILEELGLPWKFVKVEWSELKKEPFISLNPNGRVPALIDPNKDITLWESGAIVDYLIAEYDLEAKLHYTSFPEKYTTRCWEHFQMSGQGPYFGQKAWFANYHPEKLPSAIERYANEIRRVTSVIDAHLTKQNTDYLVGDKVTYADLMFIPYYKGVPVIIAPDVDLSTWEKYTSWLDRMYARPAVAKVLSAWEKETAVVLEKMKAAQEGVSVQAKPT